MLPETISMYDKIARVKLLQLSDSDLSGIYIVIGLLCAFMLIAYLRNKAKHKKIMRELEEKNPPL